MADFVKWQCPQCYQNYKLPSGKTPPAVCTNCAKAAEPAPASVDIIAEPPKPLDPSFVKVEPTKTETFREAKPDPEPQTKPKAFEIHSQSNGLASGLALFLLLLVYVIAGMMNFLYDSDTSYERRFLNDNAMGASANALESMYREVQSFRFGFIFYASGLTMIIGIQSLQYSRLCREIWQLRYEQALRHHGQDEDD